MISKTRTRYTTENSLISGMALIRVVSATHFDISTENNMKIDNEGVSLLYKLVSKLYNNLPILPVIPELIFQLMIP